MRMKTYDMRLDERQLRLIKLALDRLLKDVAAECVYTGLYEGDDREATLMHLMLGNISKDDVFYDLSWP